MHLAVCPPPPLPPLNGAGPQTAAEQAVAARARVGYDLHWRVAGVDVRSPTTARANVAEAADGACAMRVLVVAALVLDNGRDPTSSAMDWTFFVPEASVERGSALLLDDGDISDRGFDGMENLGEYRKKMLHTGSLCRLLRSFCALELLRSVAKPMASRTVVAAAAGGDGSGSGVGSDDDTLGGSSWPAWPAVAAALRIVTCGDRNVLALRTASYDRCSLKSARHVGAIGT